MPMYTKVITRDCLRRQIVWHFQHGLDQRQFYDVGEVFGCEIEIRRGRYDVDGVYGAFAEMPDGGRRYAIVVVTDSAVEEVVPVELSGVEPGKLWRCLEVLAQARALAIRHGVRFDKDGFVLQNNK